MPFDTVSDSAPVITVSTAAELEAAYDTLSNTPGGGTIELAENSEPNLQIDLRGGGDNPVHITSANPDEPVEIARIVLNDVDNLKVSNVTVDSTGIEVPAHQGDVDIDNSSAIELTDITFTSDGTMYFDPSEPDSVDGGRLAVVTGSSDITVTDTVGTGYNDGWIFLESDDITYSGNELTALQGDGVKMREVEDVLISDNYFHDFATSPNEVNHSDFIQIHSSGAETPSTDIAIVGNVMDTGNGSSVQPIWITGTNDIPFENVTVSDNLIYTGSANGIGISSADNVTVDNNTLLWNSEAETVKDTGNTSFEPRIRVDSNNTNVTVTDNIAPKVLADDDATVSGNIETSYNPNHDNYVGDHFVNAADGGDIGPDGWQLQEDSAWVGTGASASQPGGDGSWLEDQDDTPEPAPAPVVEDDSDITLEEPATGLVEEDEPEPQPADDDASQSAGDTGEDSGEDTGEESGDTLLSLDFEGGEIADESGYDSTFRTANQSSLVEHEGDTGFEIGNGKMVRMDVGNDQIHSLTSFGFEMDIQLLDETDHGRFLHFPRTFEARIEKDGSISFTLWTDEGTFTVNSGTAVLDDLETHTFAVGYDDETGVLSMVIDGEVVDKVEASGETSEAVHHGLTVGSIWGNSVDAIVDDVYLGTDPMDAGVDLSADVGDIVPPRPEDTEDDIEDDEETPDPVEEDPVEEDPVEEEPADEDEGPSEVEEPRDPQEALFAIDFEDGLEDASDYDSRFKHADDDNLVETDDGQGYHISDGEALTLHKSNEQLHELDSFGISLDLTLDDEDSTGRFLHFPRAFESRVEDDGSVSFSLTTDEGRFELNSGDVTVNDGETHNIAIGYDDEVGQLTMVINGEVVDSVAASGSTGEAVWHGLTIGSAWGDSAEGTVDNVWFGEDPEGAGVDPEDGLYHNVMDTATLPEEQAVDDGFDDDEDDLDEAA